MGGYGGASGKTKDKCYRDTGGHKVKDKNAITGAEHYIAEGKYVAFLQEINGQKRSDLSIEGIHAEVKGMISQNPSKVADNIDEAFNQVYADNFRYPKETHREGMVIILSKYPNYAEAQKIVSAGVAEAYRKGYIRGKVKMLHNGVMYDMN